MNNPAYKPIVRRNPIDYRVKTDKHNNHSWVIHILTAMYKDGKFTYREYISLLHSLLAEKTT